jgi:hypothetical protein
MILAEKTNRSNLPVIVSGHCEFGRSAKAMTVGAGAR